MSSRSSLSNIIDIYLYTVIDKIDFCMFTGWSSALQKRKICKSVTITKAEPYTIAIRVGGTRVPLCHLPVSKQFVINLAIRVTWYLYSERISLVGTGKFVFRVWKKKKRKKKSFRSKLTPENQKSKNRFLEIYF